jgi:hypothetical protein
MTPVSRVAADITEIENTWIALSDGCRLAARLWLPPDAEKQPVPAILEYLPYRKRDTTAERDALNHAYFAANGYAGVRVDLRGCGDSDGIILGEYLQQEQDDALEVIAWIADQPWCDGNVGMIGISWGGFNGLQVAARQPPALKAVISLCSTDDRYADDIHSMGGCLLTDKMTWGASMLSRYTTPPDPALVGERWRDMWLERMNNSGLWVAEWHAHLRRDAFYKHGSICEDYSAVKTPVYLVGGWADGYSNTIFRMLTHLECPSKALVGPWAHRYPNMGLPGPAIGFLQECIRWWDHWLKDIDSGIMDEPRLRVWMQEPVPPRAQYDERPGRWVCEESWPTPRIAAQSFGLTPDGLSENPASEGTFIISSPQTVGVSAGKWTPHGVEPDLPTDQRQDAGGALVFDSPPLAKGFEILGAPLVKLAVSADCSNAIVAAALSDVQADGSATQVSYGVLNLTHRDSHEFPQPLVPGQVYRVTLKLNEIAHHFRRGHRVRVALSSAYWPIVWPSPEPVTLEVGAADSRLELPIRPAHPQDGNLVDFEPVDGSPPLRCQRLAPSKSRWTITTDLASGIQCHERRHDSGTCRITDYDWEFGSGDQRRYCIHPDNPLSAHCEVQTRQHYARGKWRIRVDSKVAMDVTKETFNIRAELDAYEGDVRLYSRNWSQRLPRDLV